MPILGCVFGLVRWILGLVLLAALAGAAYVYVRSNPDRFKGGIEGAVEGVKGQAEEVALTTRVKAAIGLRDAFRNLEIAVSSERGVVTVRGRVPSDGLRNELASVVAAVPGVSQVVNFVEVDSRVTTSGSVPSDTRTAGERLDDEALELKIRAAFELDRDLKDAEISVTSYRRDVTLFTGAADARLKRAEAVVRSISGVKSVTIDRQK